MAPTTRSTKGRSSAGSLPQVQAGPSRGTSQQGTSQRTAGAASRSGAVVVSSDDDDDDDDDDDEDDNENEEDEDEDDDDENDDDESEDESGDDSDNDDGGQQQGQTNLVNGRRMALLRIFASTEPNGFTMNEINAGQDNVVSAKYHELINIVEAEALANPRLYNNILRVMQTPSDEWSGLIYARLRDRLDLAIRRPDPNMIGDTAKRLTALIEAIREVTVNDYWDEMEIVTRLLFFGLLLKVIRHIVASDVKVSRPGSGSGGSSPYTGDPAMNHNLYHIMVNNYQCFIATNLLHQLFGRLGAHLDVRQMALLRELLDIVKAKYNGRGSPSAADAQIPSGSFLLALQRLCNGKFCSLCSLFPA